MYMEEKVPLAKVDVDAGVKAKFSDLVADAGISVLRVLLMGMQWRRSMVFWRQNIRTLLKILRSGSTK